MNKIKLSLSIGFWALLNALIVVANGQTPGSLDLTFNSSDIGFDYDAGANDFVRTIAVQSDGEVFVGGNFSLWNGYAINRIARLNTNQTVDTSFNVDSGANNTVWSSVIQSDRKILIGGYFTEINAFHCLYKC